jgi:hypothetical protein
MRLVVLFLISVYSSFGQTLDRLKLYDTLEIIAQFNECGEWGGHRENLRVIKFENGLLLYVKITDVECNVESSLQKPRLKDTIQLTKRDIETIEKYVTSFQNIPDKINFTTNGPNSYYIKSPDSLMTIIRDRKWKIYQDFRNEILKNSH